MSSIRETICSLFAAEHITQVGFLPFADAKVINPRLTPDGVQSVVVLVAPYDTGEHYTDGISAYAHVTDYHLFFTGLYERILPRLREAFPGQAFYGFADHSPINEKDAAAQAGLGVLGCNSLLINEVYGSYVFLGSLLTDLPIPCHAQQIRFCERCGACIQNCPAHAISETGIRPDLCFSALSQKKRLTEAELACLRREGIAWGCDRCQEVCPHNASRAATEIPFFLEHRHGNFTATEVSAMTDDEFQRHAFSWRGRERITSNLQNLAAVKENSNNNT